jgi:hypothetical protein
MKISIIVLVQQQSDLAKIKRVRINEYFFENGVACHKLRVGSHNYETPYDLERFEYEHTFLRQPI